MNSAHVTAHPIEDIKIENLKSRALSGGVITVGSQAVKFVLQTGATMVMARLLTPADFGLVAMVSSLLGFVILLKDFGLSTATVQKQSITPDELSILFWINVLIGLFIMAVLFICAPLVGSFYHEPRARNIAMAFGGMALLSSLAAQHAALLQRQMRFGSLAARDLLALLAGIICGVVAALFGLQYWALIIMQAANTTAGTVFLWWKSGWRPKLVRRTSGLNQLLKFGGSLTVANLLAYANHNLDNILLGKFFGDVAVGFYSRAQGILNKPLAQVLPPIMNVATPLFSRLMDDQIKFGKAAIKLTEITCFGGCLLVLGIFSTADWIVLLILGSQWLETTPVFRLLALFGLLEPLSWLLGTILVASGSPEAMAKWRALTLVVVLISFIIGLPWGILGVAAAYVSSGVITRIWLIFFVGKRTGISSLTFISACAPFVLVAGVVSTLMTLLRSFWEPQSPIAGFISFFLLGTTMYLTGLICIPAGRRFLRMVSEMGFGALKDFNAQWHRKTGHSQPPVLRSKQGL